jgi:hypothetical protein
MADETTTTGTDNGAGAEGQNAGTGTATTTTQDTDRKFTQADLDRAISARLERERKTAEDKVARERAAADTERMKQQQEWEELAKTHEQTLREREAEFEPIKTRYEALADLENKRINNAMKDWPADARGLVPDTDDVAARLAAFDRVNALLTKGVLAPRTPGNTPGPRPQAGPDGAQKTEEYLRANGRYSTI